MDEIKHKVGIAQQALCNSSLEKSEGNAHPTATALLTTHHSPLPTPHFQITVDNYFSKKRVAKFCSLVGESALALRMAAAKRA